jgi:hypothetical protein
MGPIAIPPGRPRMHASARQGGGGGGGGDGARGGAGRGGAGAGRITCIERVRGASQGQRNVCTLKAS